MFRRFALPLELDTQLLNNIQSFAGLRVGEPPSKCPLFHTRGYAAISRILNVATEVRHVHGAPLLLAT
jgi:hypothetical protein